MKNLFIVFGMAVAALLCSCKSDSSDFMAFDNVRYVENFPKSFDVPSGDSLALGLLGMQSLKVQDSLLIVSTTDAGGFWSFFRLPDCTPLGNYITKGRSNGEFISSPRVFNQYFYESGDGLYVRIYDFYTGKLSEMNVSATLRDGKTDICKLQPELERNLFNVVCMDSVSFFCREVNPGHTEQNRFVFDRGNENVFPNLAKLNAATVSPGSDINILGTYCVYDPVRNRVAEAAMDLNLINLYSVDSEFPNMTLCPVSKLDRIADVEDVKRSDKEAAYCHLSGYDDYFAALYIGDTLENIHYGKAKAQRIQFFSWNGEPLAELVLDRYVNSFDIDFSRGVLYTLNYEKDEIYSYGIKEILEYLRNAGN